VTRNVATPLAIAGISLSVAAVVIAIVRAGIDAQSAPILLSLVGILGTAMTGAVAALRSNEAASRAGDAATHAVEARQVAEVTASKTSALQQAFMAHCGEVCTAGTCPLRVIKPQEVPA